MDKGTGIATTINGDIVVLVFNEDVLLDATNSALVISFPESENNGWDFRFIFSDDVPVGQRAFSSKITFEDQGNTIIITYYSWYGNGIETSKPHYIESVDRKLKLYIITRTTAVKGVASRKVQVCMWKVPNP